MDDMVRCAQRGWDILLRAAVPLLVGGLVWTGLNLFTQGLLAGPALVGLFVIALKTHQRREAEVADVFAAFDDVAAPLVAGIAFILPFGLSSFLSTEIGAAPFVLSIFLAVWFAIGIHVFAALADRPEDGLAGAATRAWRLAESGPRGRVSGLALHLLYGVGAFLLICLGGALPFIGSLTFVITVPAAVCLLTAWHARKSLPSESVVAGAAMDVELLEAEFFEPAPSEPTSPAGPRAARKKTPSRRTVPAEPKLKSSSDDDSFH